MKALFKLAIFVLLVHGLFRFVPPYWNFTQFKSALKERAAEWREHPEPAVVDEVLRLAHANDVPITAENVRVRRERDHLYVDVTYVAPIEVIPSVRRDWTFTTSVDAWTLTGVRTP